MERSNLSDRELLELAAKAAGKFPHPDGTIYAGFGSREWNPLTDDGDALRLAVRCCVEIDCGRTSSIVFRGHIGQHVVEEPVGNDPNAATRRAIVRAAAEIGLAA